MTITAKDLRLFVDGGTARNQLRIEYADELEGRSDEIRCAWECGYDSAILKIIDKTGYLKWEE